MSSSLEIDNKKLQSVGVAAGAVGYSRDYVTKLARDKKIIATQVGRQWFVDAESLEQYAKQSEAEQKIRQQELSELRKEEREKSLQQKINKTPTASFVTRQKSALAMMALLGIASTYSLIHFSPFAVSGFSGAQVVGSELVPDFKPAETEYEIAVGTTILEQESVTHTVDFSQESVRLSDIQNFQNGILLLPHSTSTGDNEPEALFSDKVKILTDENGQQYVARVNEKNEVIAEIPFVVVPVANNQDTP